MQQHDALVAIDANHDAAETAFREVAENGLDDMPEIRDWRWPPPRRAAPPATLTPVQS